MNLKNKPPIFVPPEYRYEIEKLSKAALMDLVWDFAETDRPNSNVADIMETLRKRAGIILIHRAKP